MRGEVKKKIFPFLSEGRRRMLWLHPAQSQFWRGLWARGVFRADQAVGGELDSFMTHGHSTPSVLEATQAKRGGFSGPTMVLSETRGLQLFWVMRGGIRCIWRLGAKRQRAGPSSLIDTLPRPRASQEPIG
jgi:hypothetical protein